MYLKFKKKPTVIFPSILTRHLFVLAIVGTPWIITAFRYATMFASKYQAIWTVVQFRLVVDTFPIAITIGDIADHTSFNFAWILLVWFQLLSQGTRADYLRKKRNKKKKNTKRGKLLGL